ncbi:vesicle-associated membrane protein 72 [Pycnococcus provasolii]
MSLIYALIARSTTVLVEYSAYSGNFSTVAIQCLPRAPAPATAGADARTTFTADAHAFHMQVSDGFTFLVVAETTAGRQVPFACLDRIKEDFLRKHGAEARTAIAHSMDGTYASALKGHLEFCMQHPDELSKVSKVKAEVTQVKNIMLDNIERVLDRGEKIELLVDKTENLRSQADTFHRTGRQLRTRMWWQNLKMKLLVGSIVLGVILVIFLVSCYSGGRNCTAKH